MKWSPVMGCELYRINDGGAVETRTNGRHGQAREWRAMTTGKTKDGYPVCQMKINGRKFTRTIHRLVAMHFIDNPEKKPEVNHIDGNKQNNSVSNLEWVTHKENMDHASRMNLFRPPMGHNNHKTVYDDIHALTAITFINAGKMAKELADTGFMKQATVSAIMNGRFKKHLAPYIERHPRKKPRVLMQDYSTPRIVL